MKEIESVTYLVIYLRCVKQNTVKQIKPKRNIKSYATEIEIRIN